MRRSFLTRAERPKEGTGFFGSQAAKRGVAHLRESRYDTRLAVSCPSNLSNETSKKRRDMKQKKREAQTKNLISGKSKKAKLLVICKREVKKENHRMHG